MGSISTGGNPYLLWIHVPNSSRPIMSVTYPWKILSFKIVKTLAKLQYEFPLLNTSEVMDQVMR